MAQQQSEEMQRKLPLIAKVHTTGEKSQTCDPKESSIVPWSGQWTPDHTLQSHEPCSMPQTSRSAATGNICHHKPSSTDGNTKSKLPSFDEAATRAAVPNISVREQWLLAGLIDRATSPWIRALPTRWRRRRRRKHRKGDHSTRRRETVLHAPHWELPTPGWTSTRWSSRIYSTTTASATTQSPTLSISSM